MSRDFFDPPWDQKNMVLVDEGMLRQAERQIRSCEACMPEAAQVPLDYVLDQLTGNDPSVTDYILAVPGKCPHCKSAVTEKTLVDLRDDGDEGENAGDSPLCRSSRRLP